MLYLCVNITLRSFYIHKKHVNLRKKHVKNISPGKANVTTEKARQISDEILVEFRMYIINECYKYQPLLTAFIIHL